METRLVETSVHGRYLLRGGPPERLLIGFHGYAETADVHMADLEKIPGAEEWTLVAVQALHPFYLRSTQEVVASWMTRVDRGHAIADNIAYVQRVVADLPETRTLVFVGFSQGGAMAYRAAVFIRCAGLIVLAGDIPPDVDDASKLPPLLIGRGVQDDLWYPAEKLEKNLRFLGSKPDVTTCVFDGGHEWSAEFRRAASVFLRRASG
jgi:dienelactone hydrolase